MQGLSRAHILASAIVALSACGGPGKARPDERAPAAASEDGSAPLSEEEARQVVALARRMESDGRTDTADIAKAVERMTTASGLTIVLCADLVAPIYDDAAGLDVTPVLVLSSAAALIETPELESDLPAVAVASLRSLVRVYRVSKQRTGATSRVIEGLDEQERQGQLGTWVAEHWGACPETTAVAREIAAEADDDTLVVGPDHQAAKGQRPWGSPVPDSEQEKRALELLLAIGTNKADAEVFDEVFVVGPALYRLLLNADREGKRTDIETIGTPSTTIVPTKDGATKMPMRSYLEPEHHVQLLRTISFRAFARAFADGSARPATEAEREAFYALIPFEIASKPVTVVEVEGHIAVIYIEDGKLFWADILSQYRFFGAD